MRVGIGPMRVRDVDAALGLINAYAAEDRMLERTRDFLLEHIHDFFVAESESPASSPDGAGFEGCVALAVLTPELAEIRSLAVRPETGGRGVGRALVAACVDEARRLGLKRVFALTLVPEFFVSCGFTLVSLGRLPEKSASECPICPKRGRCDEHAMLLHLDGTKPEPLRPDEPIGYTALHSSQGAVVAEPDRPRLPGPPSTSAERPT
ncbi:MAG: GNAT family N-acetyltransferase [Chloroflexi bacterium]|nr:GNAT family N-acetyltransferase [Chloroflexota bacterium]